MLEDRNIFLIVFFISIFLLAASIATEFNRDLPPDYKYPVNYIIRQSTSAHIYNNTKTTSVTSATKPEPNFVINTTTSKPVTVINDVNHLKTSINPTPNFNSKFQSNESTPTTETYEDEDVTELDETGTEGPDRRARYRIKVRERSKNPRVKSARRRPASKHKVKVVIKVKKDKSE